MATHENTEALRKAPMPADSNLPYLRLEPSQGWVSLKLKELWEYRELLYFLTWRDIKVRYKQTILGAAWAILQPFMTMVVFSLFFGRLTNMPSDGVPYPILTARFVCRRVIFIPLLTQHTYSPFSSASAQWSICCAGGRFIRSQA